MSVSADEGACEKSPDGQHCEHWWDCEPCHYCGHDSGGEGTCDCERHAGKQLDQPDQN